MRFLRVFLASVVLLVVPWMLVARVVDPRGDFGGGIFPSLTIDPWREKIPRFDAFAAGHRDVGLVLGSSRSMMLRPSELEVAFGTPFFNFATNNARAEDELAAYMWVTKRPGVRIDALVLGLDVEALSNDFVPSDSTARRVTGDLSEYRHAGVNWRRYQDTLSNGYLADVVQSIRLFAPAYLRRQSLESGRLMTFDPDGYERSPQVEARKRAGTFDLQREIDQSVRAYYYRYVDMTALSSARQAYFEQIISDATASHVRVIVFVTPLHPATIEYLRGKTRYDDMLSLTRSYLAHLKDQFAIEVHDFSEIERFGGTRADWQDCCHIDSANATRIVAGLKQH